MRKILLRGAVSLAFLVLLFYLVREDLPRIAEVIRHTNHRLMALCVLIFLASIVVMARRLQLIFGVKGAPISLWEAYSLTMVGYFFNNFLPTSVGGDIVKAMCATRMTKSALTSVTSVLMDRIFGLFTFILIPSLTLFLYMKNIDNPAVPIVVYVLLAGSAFFFVFIFNRSLARRFRFIEDLLNRFGVGQKLRSIYDGLHDFKNHKGAIFFAMALSVVGQVISLLTLYLMSVAMGASASLVTFFLLVPVVHLMSMLPSLNGLGIREWAYVFFLEPHVGKEIAFSLGIAWFGLLFLLSVIGGVIYLIRHDYHIRFKGAVPEPEVAA